MSTVESMSGSGQESLDFRNMLWHELGLFFLVLLEVSWIVPWFRSSTPLTSIWSTGQALLILMAIALGALYTSRVLVNMDVIPILRSIIMLALLAGSTVLVLNLVFSANREIGLTQLVLSTLSSFSQVLANLPPQLVIVMTMLYLWWRGSIASTLTAISPRRAGREFRLIVLGLGVLALLYRGEQVRATLEILPISIGAGLMAMGIARAESLTVGRTGTKPPFDSGWLAGLAAMVVAIVGVGVGAGMFLRSDTASSLAGLIVIVILILALLVISPLLVLLFIGLTSLLNLLMGSMSGGEAMMPQMESLEAIQEVLTEMQREAQVQPPRLFQWFAAHSAEIKILMTTLVILLLARGIIRMLRSVRDRRERSTGETAVSLFSKDSLLDDLRERLQQVREALRPGRYMEMLRQSLTSSVVRRIYSRLMEMVEETGYGRESHETPLEYLVRLHRIFPENQAEATIITQAYVQVRYGELPEERIDLEQVRESWRALRKAGIQAARNSGELDSRANADVPQTPGN